MQIKIDLKILIFALVFFITNQIRIYILLMIFACIHELGHILVGLCLGFKPTLIEVRPIGYSVQFFNKIEDYNKKIFKSNLLELKKIFVYMAGPILNFLIVFVLMHININSELAINLVYINLILGIINLLPIYPLDGGRIIKSIICLFFGIKKSYIYIEKISNIFIIILLAVSSLAILYLKNIGLIFVLAYLIIIRLVESKKVMRKIELYNIIEK